MSQKAVSTSQSAMNTEEVKEFMRYIIKNNQHLQKNNKFPAAVEIEGESGYGKTSVIKQLTEEMSMAFIKLNLAQIEELGDLVGFPVKEFEVVKEEEGKAPIAKWVQEITLNNYIHNKYKPTGQKRMSHAIPQWIQGKTDGGILLLDDWNRADPRFVQAMMELIDRQEYISWKLPKNWHIVLTANPDDGSYMVHGLDPAQRSRFIRVRLDFDLEVWATWAEKNGIDGRCINFMLLYPETMKKESNKENGINARSLTTFFNAITSITSFEDTLPLIQKIGEGCVGPEMTTLFTSFINNRLDKLITPKEILLGNDEKAVVESIQKLVGRGDKYRMDIASVITTRLINFALHYAETKDITKQIIDRLEKIISQDDMLSNDLKYLLVRRLFNGSPKFKSLLDRQTVMKYAAK